MKNIFFLGLLLIGLAINQTQAQSISDAETRYISVDFLNNSLTSIPLHIEGVMNPNLSPMSRSSVTAVEGTKVYYRKKGKNALIFTFTEEYDNREVAVNEILKEQGLR